MTVEFRQLSKLHLNLDNVEIQMPKFQSSEFHCTLYCSVNRCEERILLAYAWCEEHFFYYHLIEDAHLHL